MEKIENMIDNSNVMNRMTVSIQVFIYHHKRGYTNEKIKMSISVIEEDQSMRNFKELISHDTKFQKYNIN